MRVAESICPGYAVNHNNRSIISNIFRWCMMLDGELNPTKGLWLYGNIGTGKSTLLHIIKCFCHDIRPRDADGNYYSFAIVNASEICADFTKRGYEGIDVWMKSSRLAIDERGREPMVTGYYGNAMNVLQQILQTRYDNRFNNFTHVTTNLTEDEIKARYHAHIYDRCKEMFNFVYFGGATFRKR